MRSSFKPLPLLFPLCLWPMLPAFGAYVHFLPNVKMERLGFWPKSPEELETQAHAKESKEHRERALFRNDEKTKTDMALVEKTVERLKSLHIDQIEAILGPRQEIPENYLLPAVYWPGTVTLSAHQNAGESSIAFLPVGELGGIYVIQYENRSTISAAVIYLKRDHSYKTDDRAKTLEAREAAREAERPELHAIKAALMKVLDDAKAEHK